jgi:hypothetical protein
MKRLSIKITSNAKTLSSYSGLHLFSNLISKFEIQSMLGSLLPQKQRDRGLKSFQKFFSGIMAFIAGAECLDDLDALAQDPLFYELTDGPASTTMGKFLRLFSAKQIQDIRNQLPMLAYKIRLWLDPKLYKIVFKMDGTIHQQYGKKMEGVEFSYRQVNGLSSQNLFDDKGFCYGFALRNGSAHSSVGAIEMMENAFKVIPKSIQKFFVADSAYGSIDIYNSLLNHNVNFAICLSETVWGSLLKNYGNKITWKDTSIRFFDSKNCEIGDVVYPKKGLNMGRTFLRVVFIRTKKKIIQSGDNHPYHYYAIVTNMSSSEMTSERLILFYRKRAQVENNIKDLKNGLDFHHFPCQSLKANHAWGLMGIIAYNLMRLASFTISKNGCFVDSVRKNIVMKACEVIKHARSVELRMMSYMEKEVQRLSMILSNAFFRTDVRLMNTTNVATHHL